MTQGTNSADQLIDVHDMVIVHRAFRREFRLIPGLVRAATPGDVARAKVLADHIRLGLTGLHLHHTGEDVLLWPKLLERTAPSAELIHRMEAQHARVAELVDALPAVLTRWEAEARPADGEEVASMIDELGAVLVEHLDDEEEHILPLAARHMAQEEWAAMGEHGMDKMEKAHLPILFGMILEDATPEERKEMMKIIPVPARLFLRTVGAWQYRRYVRSVRYA